MLWFDEDPLPLVVIPNPQKQQADITDLKRMRLEAGITQSALADELGISQPFLSQCEAGRKDLPDDYAVAWFAALRDLRAQRMRDRETIRRILYQRRAS